MYLLGVVLFDGLMAFNALSELHPGNSLKHSCGYVSRLWHHCGGTDNGPSKHTEIWLHLTLSRVTIGMQTSLKNLCTSLWMCSRRQGLWYPQILSLQQEICLVASGESQYMIRFKRYTIVVWRDDLEAESPFCSYAPTPVSQLPRPINMPECITDSSGW
ncbi:uncharacterized protein [Aegilops tauschii subsp. strangulata]|uniref:uncharacterized protein n=1 Tax=Aegilops tauschii subsp. strangulata TaxID=200361 RepID=UPI003CC8526A